MSTPTASYEIRLGKVSSCLKIDDSIIRFIIDPPDDEDDKDYSSYQAQGHLSNTTDYSIDNLVIDISYYDKNNKFLGLNKTGMLNVEEMDPKETIPFDIELDIPEGTDTCVLNASARVVSGWWARMFLGAKK